MKKDKVENSRIKGHLDIHFEISPEEGSEILIHGNPDGLRNLASIILELANYDQEKDEKLPINARKHLTLNTGIDLSSNSCTTTIGRLDAKLTKEYYPKYKSRN